MNKFKKPRVGVPKPKLPRKLRRKDKEQRTQEAISSLPKITNETVAEHREEVLRGARKYIYPLEHSKHRIVKVSVALLVVAFISFFVYIGLALYKFQSTSGFIYRVTQIVPLPVAKAGPRFVAYENYLFELRRYIHYYQTQQRVDFSSKGGKEQLSRYKPVAMQAVVDAAYVKMLAEQHNITVSEKEVDAALDSLRAQNKLGSSNQELSDVTKEFFGWSVDDLRRELKQELLAQKVAATLDTGAQGRANAAHAQLQGGADFAAVAKQLSEDEATKPNGGQYADTAITLASTEVPPAVVQQLYKMKVGEISGVVTTGNSLEIVKLTGNADGKLQAAHISFKLKDPSAFVAPLQKEKPTDYYISVGKIQTQPQQ
ncbi:hypothetical protein EYC59_03540 [Candidatus Saccharibacteria bacterium]|nr:MAG: hypothetical protein EYC59_03540 [Candidatus Saccharibacteria bacterium]